MTDIYEHRCKAFYHSWRDIENIAAHSPCRILPLISPAWFKPLRLLKGRNSGFFAGPNPYQIMRKTPSFCSVFLLELKKFYLFFFLKSRLKQMPLVLVCIYFIFTSATQAKSARSQASRSAEHSHHGMLSWSCQTLGCKHRGGKMLFFSLIAVPHSLKFMQHFLKIYI